ncbi:M23 family metallopeptidase [Ammoniphilus sp. YIM 78166]|uniref:M23 family metallopeptidase n=1 Tax=Ammoniphilus sp. YIM 78166 TaxID=1644106 RepID=UPI00106FC6B1|nr:M23 family metallopeptidase [Ammoniphilus sp. YIM 78166]
MKNFTRICSVMPFLLGLPLSIPAAHAEMIESAQYIQVSEQQEQMTKNKEKIASDHAKVAKVTQALHADPLFQGLFLMPVEGRITTPYAYTRYVNGKRASRHNAIDIAAPQGTPILAANSGKIIMAEELYLSGKRVMIDHGMGLVSSYSHLKELNVKEGDPIQKGDVIGFVGSTGFSTGPHLHLAFLLNGVPVNPQKFFYHDPFEQIAELSLEEHAQ